MLQSIYMHCNVAFRKKDTTTKKDYNKTYVGSFRFLTAKIFVSYEH